MGDECCVGVPFTVFIAIQAIVPPSQGKAERLSHIGAILAIRTAFPGAGGFYLDEQEGAVCLAWCEPSLSTCAARDTFNIPSPPRDPATETDMTAAYYPPTLVKPLVPLGTAFGQAWKRVRAVALSRKAPPAGFIYTGFPAQTNNGCYVA